MSKGPGIVQRRILAAVEAEPSRVFQVLALAAIVYPNATIEEKHLVCVRRAISKMPQLKKGRDGNYRRKGGWHYAIQLG
jgi:hypothetical protein